MREGSTRKENDYIVGPIGKTLPATMEWSENILYGGRQKNYSNSILYRDTDGLSYTCTYRAT